MADTRKCAQCGMVFTPRREHARFCSAGCRMAWNRETMGHPAAQTTALTWSITAMGEATDRLPKVRTRDQPRAFAVIAEAVWWVTIVDATLVRHHPDTYDSMLAAQSDAERRKIEETLAGLRFVRNQMGPDADHVDFVKPGPGLPGRRSDRVTAWRWTTVPEPELAALPPRAQDWEIGRYQAYQAQLADRTIGETFGLAEAFLQLTAANAAIMAEADRNAAP